MRAGRPGTTSCTTLWETVVHRWILGGLSTAGSLDLRRAVDELIHPVDDYNHSDQGERRFVHNTQALLLLLRIYPRTSLFECGVASEVPM